jgi:soluble lytic murein transglycosylase-like protein
LQRKRALSTLVTPVLSHVRQLGRGSNTFCVGAFALSLVNLAAIGPSGAPAQPAAQPPALQAYLHAVAPPQSPALTAASPLTAAAPASTPKTATPAPPGEASKPAGAAETTRPATPTPPAATQTAPPAAPAAARTEAPAPAAPAPPLQKTSPVPAPPKPIDEVERLRKAADLLVRVNTALGEPQSPYGKIIYDVAIRHSINPHLVAALIHVESAFNARAVSPKGAYGLMQLLPETARRFGLNKKKDLFDPRKNLEAGVRYLKWLADRFGGDTQKILAAYNAGEGAVERFGGIPPYQETQSYVQKIFGLLGFSSAPAPVPQAAATLPSVQDAMAAR